MRGRLPHERGAMRLLGSLEAPKRVPMVGAQR